MIRFKPQSIVVCLGVLVSLTVFIGCQNSLPLDVTESSISTNTDGDNLVERTSIEKTVQIDKDTLSNDSEFVMITSENFDETTSLNKIKSQSSYITQVYIKGGNNRYIRPPSPYIKISRGENGNGNGDLNEGARGDYIYLCYTRENRFGSPIRNFRIHSGGERCYPPSGYYHVPNSYGYSGNSWRGADLNKHSGGDYIYLMATKNTNIGNPIKEIGIISTNYKLHSPPSGWHWINSDLNRRAGGKWIYFLYKDGTPTPESSNPTPRTPQVSWHLVGETARITSFVPFRSERKRIYIDPANRGILINLYGCATSVLIENKSKNWYRYIGKGTYNLPYSGYYDLTVGQYSWFGSNPPNSWALVSYNKKVYN